MTDQPMLTKDGRCPQCGETITTFKGELGHEALIDGVIRPVSVTYVLQPCGHFLTKAAANRQPDPADSGRAASARVTRR